MLDIADIPVRVYPSFTDTSRKRKTMLRLKLCTIGATRYHANDTQRFGTREHQSQDKCN